MKFFFSLSGKKREIDKNLSFFTRGFARVEDDAHISHDTDDSVAQGNGIMSSRPFVGT